MSTGTLVGQELINAAALLSEQLHEGQLYGEYPYTFHTQAVAALIELAGYQPEVVAGGHLHDTIEDVPGVDEQFLLERRFPVATVLGVLAVSYGENEQLSKVEKAMQNPVGHVIKYYDVEHNLMNTEETVRQIEANGDVVPEELQGTFASADEAREYLAQLRERHRILGENLPTPAGIAQYLRSI